MDSSVSLLKDCFGNTYQLTGASGVAHAAAQRMNFYCPEMTGRFLRSLKVPLDYWRRFAANGESGRLPNQLSDNEVLGTVTDRLIKGSLTAYEFPPMGKRALRDGKGFAFSFVRGPEPFPTDSHCLGEQEAREHLGGLHASPAYWHELLQENGLAPQGVHPETTSEGEYRGIVRDLLASRELLLYKTHDAPSTPKGGGGGGETESAANAPGNRVAHKDSPPSNSSGGQSSANTKGTQDGPALGGRHRETKVDGTKHGTQSHHLIADDASDIATDDALAIRMETDDHVYRTGSWGSRKSSKRFRAKQKALVSEGKYDEALEMGINDVKSQNPGKYDQHIDQMLESAPRKADNTIDWSQFKRK